MWKTFLNLIFPPREPCAICGKKGKIHQDLNLCHCCMGQIELVKQPYCQRCGKPWQQKMLGYKGNEINQTDMLCFDCKTHEHNFVLARAIAVYQGIIQEAVHRLKFQHSRKEAEWLGRFLALGIKNFPEISDYALIVPVPLSEERLLDRGYNQAELLARAVGFYYKKPVLANCLKRTRVTQTQSKLSRTERFANIRGAFAAGQPENIYGKNIMVIDDVFTTGSTTDECARVLVGQGAASVMVLTLATGKIML